MTRRSLAELVGASPQSAATMRALTVAGLIPLVAAGLLVAALGVARVDYDLARAGGLAAIVFLFVYSGTILMYALFDVTDPRMSLPIAMGAYSAKIIFVIALVTVPGITDRVAGCPFAALIVGGVLWWIVVHVRVSWRLTPTHSGSD